MEAFCFILCAEPSQDGKSQAGDPLSIRSSSVAARFVCAEVPQLCSHAGEMAEDGRLLVRVFKERTAQAAGADSRIVILCILSDGSRVNGVFGHPAEEGGDE